MNIYDFEARDTFSSLEIIERIDELEELTEEGRTGNEDDELQALQSFASDAESYSRDWHDGTILINAEAFTDYIREQIEEMEDRVDFDRSPYCHIDWDMVAEDAAYDYQEVYLNGTYFWISNH